MPDDFETKSRIPTEKERQSDDPQLAWSDPGVNEADKHDPEPEYMLMDMDAPSSKRWGCLGCLGILLLLIGLCLVFFLWILPAIR